mmetsp:Transcript_30580/g.35003  ORF Transcript_30580/g.35003 Transcript_30580/m.35003 type:complete len:85 (+) Transcript_30580:565-819(+)
MLMPMYSRAGRVQLTKAKLVFYDSLCLIDEENEAGAGSHMLDFFMYKKKPYKLMYKVYDVDKIRYAFKRRFLFDKQCIDIIFKS